MSQHTLNKDKKFLCACVSKRGACVRGMRSDACAAACVQSAGRTLRDQTSCKAFSEQNTVATHCISATFSKWTLKCSLPPTSTTVSSHCYLLLPLPPPRPPFFSVNSCPPFLPLSTSSSAELLIESKIWRCKVCDHSPNQPSPLTKGACRRVGGV